MAVPPPTREITPEHLYARRRDFLKSAGLFAITSTSVGAGLLSLLGPSRTSGERTDLQDPYRPTTSSWSFTRGDEPLTSFADATSYNNFYEFGTDKADPARNARTLRARPWTVHIDGEVHHPQDVDVDQLTRWFPPEERVYRMRCVEGWSMVIPWLGFALGDLIGRAQPTSRARYVAFTSLEDPEQMPAVRRRVLPWPYVEGLRIDEAMHPLTILAVGLYGQLLPNQNGAPLRLVVPWKYGFKGIKSIVGIRLTEHQPTTTWNLVGPQEYGFYANVNPAVDHPRWSQATERRIGELTRRPTIPFNGYADQVASLYRDMDLRRDF